MDEEQSIIVSDVSPFGLGIEVATLMGNQLSTYYESLIEPNKTIPYSTTKKYSLMHHEQNQIRVSLYQAHRRGIRDLNDTYFTGIVGDINNIPQSMDERPHSVEVHFSYDVNGLVELTATVPETGQHLDLHANANDIKVRMRDLDKLKDILGESDNDEQNKESTSVNSFLADSLNDNVLELPRRYQKVIKKARLIVENEQDHKYHEDLSDFLEGFDAALEKNNQKKMDRYFDRIEDIILDL